jgi:hypothetical protein
MAQAMMNPVAGAFMLRRYENGTGRTKNLVMIGSVTEVEHVKQVFAGMDVSHDYLPRMSTAQEELLG